MALLSMELYKAHARGVSIAVLATRLQMTDDWIAERIESARQRIEEECCVEVRFCRELHALTEGIRCAGLSRDASATPEEFDHPFKLN